MQPGPHAPWQLLGQPFLEPPSSHPQRVIIHFGPRGVHALVGNTESFDNEIDFAGSEGWKARELTSSRFIKEIVHGVRDKLCPCRLSFPCQLHDARQTSPCAHVSLLQNCATFLVAPTRPRLHGFWVWSMMEDTYGWLRPSLRDSSRTL